ncbi:lysine-rich nucleolar protein 1 [Ctenodactylus gundi]
MITKMHKVDLGLGLPEEKKKKKKKVVREPETQYSILNDGDYFAPVRVTPLCGTASLEQALDMPLVKKKKKKKGHSTHGEELMGSEPTVHARCTKSPSPRKQALGHSEAFAGEEEEEEEEEKKKRRRRKSLLLAASHGLGQMSPDPRPGDEAAKVGKKHKRQKKEKKAQDAAAFSIGDPGLCEAGDALYGYPAGREVGEQAALGHKRKQGGPREHSGKVKKKKVRLEGDPLPGHCRLRRSVESSPEKGRKKPPAVEAPGCVPAEGPETPGKKKTKSKKKEEQPVGDELAVKKKKKKRKERAVEGDPLKEELDTDLEVVFSKKGNMDEAHVDQVRRKALQEEIDRESGKTEASEPRQQMDTQFGQWDTAGFENEERKLKFLKLMGGFKNLSPSFCRTASVAGRPNMALSKKAADTLQQSLQQDYDRALSWKYTRGAGLGFSRTPTPNKIFYIDKNASRSVRLEN